MSRWGKGWEVGFNKQLDQHFRTQLQAAEVLAAEHGTKHKDGERAGLCPKCKKQDRATEGEGESRG